jgi:hypothetical protein
MPDEALIQEVLGAAKQLASTSSTGWVDGEEIAAKLGRELNEDEGALYQAFTAASDRGDLKCDFPGGTELPSVRLP